VSGLLRTRRIGLLGLSALRNKPTKPKLIRYPPDLSIDIPDLLHVSLGPSSVFRVRGYGACLALRSPRASALSPVHPTSVTSGDNGVLAECTFSRFRVAPLARPIGPEPRATARVYQRFMVI